MLLFWKQRNYWRWFGVILLILILHWVGLLRPIENYLSKVVRPVDHYLYSIGSWFKGAPYDDLSIEGLELKLEQAQTELALATIDQAKLELLTEENDKLRQQLNFLDNNHYEAVGANIVSRQDLFNTADNAQDIILDKGARDGLRPGLGVINESGIIIGKIIEVKDYSARACLTTGSDCQLAAALLNDSKTVGLSEGELGLTIKMNFIPQMEEIKTNDILITSGLGDDIPRGLVIGRVAQVNNQSNEIWQDVTIEPLASLHNLTVVSVIIP
ncbi:MAG: rod shape-determining protein MreC [Patescibacteria group bacterium]|nr:rod shape-determining protein MreC [Patescibacteria group bacterium]